MSVMLAPRRALHRSFPASRLLSSKSSNVAHLFSTMEYGPAPEDAGPAKAWLSSHKNLFGPFINNKWLKDDSKPTAPSISPATGDVLAHTTQASSSDVDSAVAAARAALPSWSSLPGHARARHLYAVARNLQKHSRLFAVVEALDNGKPVRETRDVDVPLAVRHFYSHAGWAQILHSSFPNHKAVGVVAQVVPWNFPLLMLAWKIAPALACGNTVVLKPAPSTRLSAALFCDVLLESGLPPGVVNVLSCDNDVAQYLAQHEGVDKVAFTGSTGVGKSLARALAGTGTKLSLELGGKSPVVVYESADLDAAVEGVVSAIWFNQGQVCCAGSRLLVQESVHDELVAKLKRRMATLRVGHSLDKNVDVGAVIDAAARDRIAACVNAGKAEGAEVYQVSECPKNGSFYPPTLITKVQSSSPLVMDEIFGPVLVVQSFRTPAEAVKLANNSRYGLAAGVWTEKIGLALETALSVKAGVVWVNCHNMFDAAASFGGYKESGFGREGGKEGLYEYLKYSWKKSGKNVVTDAMRNNASWGAAQNKCLPSSPLPGAAAPGAGGLPSIDRTPKMYIGGGQKRPDGNYVNAIVSHDGKRLLGQVGDGNRKDIRDAVAAANKAAAGWGKRAAYNRAQILFYIAENLSIRRDEFAERLDALTGCGKDAGLQEVDESISRLFTYAAYADKYGGTVQEAPLYGVVSAINEPVGVLGMVLSDAKPLLQLVSCVAPAIARGNVVVVVPSEKFPLLATDLYQVLDTSDLPDGVVNIVTGQKNLLAKTLAEHQHVDGIWYFGDVEGCHHVQKLAAGNMKRTFVCAEERNWSDIMQGEGEEFLRESSEVKNIWVPIGESMAGAGGAY